MHHISRALALILAMALCLGLGSLARAENEFTATSSGAVFTEDNGKVTLQIYVRNTLNTPASLVSIVPNEKSVISGATITDLPTIPANGGVWVSANAILKNGMQPGNYSDDEELTLYLSANEKAYTTICSDYTVRVTTIPPSPEMTTPPPPPESTPDPEAKLRLSPYDRFGQVVPAPEGDYGEIITVRVPLLCQRTGVHDIKVAPVLSGDVEKFPFDIEAVDYLLTYPDAVSAGTIVEFTYNLRLSKKATTGVKQVDFNVSYRTGGAWHDEVNQDVLETTTVSVFVNVKKGLSPSASDAGGSTPKLIVESYSISSDKIYAGETFDVTITLKNTSSTEAIQNLQIGFKDTAEVAKLVPASGGSNTLYISKIGKGESVTEVISLQTAPDTEAKAYTLGVECSYEGASDNKAYTANETIAIPILQEIRVKFDDPTIYDSEAWVGQSCGMYVKMYNMGKSSLYNCMIDVEGEGLEMEESYFGGNISSGSTMAADFSIIPSVAGEIEGAVVITYEDVYGEPSEERLPFTLTVNEEISMDPTMGMDGMEGMEGMEGIEVYDPGMESGGMPWWGWTLCGLGVAGLGVGGLLLYRKKRRRHLEDV